MDQHNTLHYDETSKEGFKYGSIQVTTEQDQSYVLGLFDMDGGAAERYASFINVDNNIIIIGAALARKI